MLKGPTGCGKTRFIQHMAFRLGRPLITVACHEDLTAADLVGRYLLKGQDTVWVDGPLTLGVKHAPSSTSMRSSRRARYSGHHSPLSDDRRLLPIEKKGQILEAADDFLLVISYNPGYQSVLKDLKPSTKQRFMAIEFDYPTPDIETAIVQREAGVAHDIAQRLVKLGGKVRNLKNHGLEEEEVHQAPHLRRHADSRRRGDGAGLRRGDCPTDYRRSRHAAQHSGTREGDLLADRMLKIPLFSPAQPSRARRALPQFVLVVPRLTIRIGKG